MEAQKMTIHRALSELKLIDSKIEKTISDLNPVGVYQKDKPINNIFQADEYQKSAESKYQSVNDLIARKVAIKSAIVAANSNTNVTVAGKTMTIADAITFKTAIKFKKQLAARLTSQYNNGIGVVNKNNEIVEQNVQRILEASFGKDNVKTDSTEVDAIRKPFMTSNEFHLFDPLGIAAKIEALEKEVSEFEADVDSTLSEINAITFIEV